MPNQIVGPEETPKQIEEAARKADQNVQQAGGNKEDALKMNMEYQKMADFLGVKTEDKGDMELAGKISAIRDYVREPDELNAMIRIRDIIRSLGIQSKGKDLINNLYQYVRLASDRERIDKEISLLHER